MTHSKFVAWMGKKFNSAGALQLLNWIPDKIYIRILFWFRVGKRLDLKNPKTFNEKLQWLKLYDRRPEYTMMVDKYEAKEFVARIIGDQYIIPTLGVWEKVEDIDWDKLPQRFVLKCTHDSGGLVICRDKSKLDIASAKEKLNRCLKTNYYWSNREWPYKDVKPRIIAETYMEDESTHETEVKGLTDYKFFCFNGEPKFLYISKGLEKHATALVSFYSLTGQELYFHRKDYKPYHDAIMPNNNIEMIGIAKKIANSIGASFVRIDLYSINEQLYFSEITFLPCSGFIPFDPITADKELGDMLYLEKQRSPFE